MRIGTKASADVASTPKVCRISPAVSFAEVLQRTKYNFAAIEYADHLVPRRLVVIDFEQFCESAVLDTL